MIPRKVVKLTSFFGIVLHELYLTVVFIYLFIHSLFTGLLSTPLEISTFFFKHDRYQLDAIAN